jgi:hypothetical protein
MGMRREVATGPVLGHEELSGVHLDPAVAALQRAMLERNCGGRRGGERRQRLDREQQRRERTWNHRGASPAR